MFLDDFTPEKCVQEAIIMELELKETTSKPHILSLDIIAAVRTQYMSCSIKGAAAVAGFIHTMCCFTSR